MSVASHVAALVPALPRVTLFPHMYSLRLPADAVPPPDGTLGRLEMRWRQVTLHRPPRPLCALTAHVQPMGDSGSLHTVVNMQQFKQPEPASVELTVVPANAASIFVEEPFELIVTVKNRGAAPLASSSLLLPCNTEASVIPLGPTEIPIPAVGPGASTSLTVQMLPVEQGLREITGVCVQDAVTFAIYQVCARPLYFSLCPRPILVARCAASHAAAQMTTALFVNVRHVK